MTRYTRATLVQPVTRQPTTWKAGQTWPVGTPVTVEWDPGKEWARIHVGYCEIDLPLGRVHEVAKSIR